MNEEQIKLTGVIIITVIILSTMIYDEYRKYLRRRKQKRIDDYITKHSGDKVRYDT